MQISDLCIRARRYSVRDMWDRCAYTTIFAIS